MSVLKKYFDKSVNQASPVVDDFSRVVSHDEDGVEYITYEKVDYPTLQQSFGTIDLWSLDAMLKAGISPDMPIHTSAPSRIEGVDKINQFNALADELLADLNKE